MSVSAPLPNAYPTEVKEQRLEKESELRFEVNGENQFIIKLKSGSAEIFGIEMAMEREYAFSNTKGAVFTWYGCLLETKGNCDVSYASDETPMASYVNTHAQLELARSHALTSKKPGPRVLVTGPTDSGKSTLCKILLNYAVRVARKPISVDLDVGQGELSVPGTIVATPLDTTNLSVEEGFILTTPLTYFYGHSTLDENPDLYKKLVDRLALSLNRRLEKNEEANVSGIIVNTCGWVEGIGYDIILHCIRSLQINVVLVLGQDRLYSDLKNALSSDISVVKMPRSGGVVPRNSSYRRKTRMKHIRQYFYGTTASLEPSTLSPYVQQLAFDDILMLRITDVDVSSVMLPVGQNASMDRLKVVKVALASDLVHSLVAVCHASTNNNGVLLDGKDSDQDDYMCILDTNIAGFIYIKEVDMEAKQIVVLCPCPGPLPSKHLLIGSIKWIE